MENFWLIFVDKNFRAMPNFKARGSLDFPGLFEFRIQNVLQNRR